MMRTEPSPWQLNELSVLRSGPGIEQEKAQVNLEQHWWLSSISLSPFPRSCSALIGFTWSSLSCPSSCVSLCQFVGCVPCLPLFQPVPLSLHSFFGYCLWVLCFPFVLCLMIVIDATANKLFLFCFVCVIVNFYLFIFFFKENLLCYVPLLWSKASALCLVLSSQHVICEVRQPAGGKKIPWNIQKEKNKITSTVQYHND